MYNKEFKSKKNSVIDENIEQVTIFNFIPVSKLGQGSYGEVVLV